MDFHLFFSDKFLNDPLIVPKPPLRVLKELFPHKNQIKWLKDLEEESRNDSCVEEPMEQESGYVENNYDYDPNGFSSDEESEEAYAENNEHEDEDSDLESGSSEDESSAEKPVEESSEIKVDESEQPKLEIRLMIRMEGGEKKIIVGTGSSKRAAKVDAAKKALQHLVIESESNC